MSERIARDASDEVEGWLATRRGQLVEVALEATISGEYALVMQAEGDLTASAATGTSRTATSRRRGGCWRFR